MSKKSVEILFSGGFLREFKLNADQTSLLLKMFRKSNGRNLFFEVDGCDVLVNLRDVSAIWVQEPVKGKKKKKVVKKK